MNGDVREQDIRTAAMLGAGGLSRLQRARVLIFGLGGVGGHLCDALARAGVGSLDLVDHDTVSPSNINRQMVALQSTLGQHKIDVMAARIRDINPDCHIRVYRCFYLPEEADRFDFSAYDYIVDAIDTVRAKIDIVMRAKAAGVPVISAMGAGNKLDPTRFEVADIAKTSVCPLAKVMRVELRRRGVEHLKVVYSREEPHTPPKDAPTLVSPDGSPKRAPASISFVPAVVGLIMAGEVIKDLSAIICE
ncbi:MAG: tRNA threonylcarbamoyladenosine dehydratase [Clostridia bacterium]|nr:tRNA threonylcarbamoyladenosine dehydratase [Clostridia bacterium]